MRKGANAYEYPQAQACLPYNARVHTDHGLIPIGELLRRLAIHRQEISAFDRNGQPTRSRAAVCNGKRSLIRFDFEDGSSLRMTSNHVVFVLRSDGSLVEKLAGDLEVGKDRLLRNRFPTPAAGPEAKDN